MGDAVDDILSQWSDVLPDLDTSPMGVIGRLSRVQRLVSDRLNAVFAEHDLGPWDFDVLATLRRSGEPYRLTAGQLVDTMMITSGAITNRIDRLEQRGLVQRIKGTDDARVRYVELTDAGRTVIDPALYDHVANERELLAGLDETTYAALDDGLRTWLNVLGDDHE